MDNSIDKTLATAIQTKIDNLNKPKGSLGRLEELAMQICLIQQTLSPSLAHPCHLLLGGDHGIEREGVSVSPRCSIASAFRPNAACSSAVTSILAATA